MRRTAFLTTLLLILILTAGYTMLYGASSGEADQAEVYGTWVSLLPPLVAIGFALISREVIISLFSGVWVGSLFLTGYVTLTASALCLVILVFSLSTPVSAGIMLSHLILRGYAG